MPAPNSEINVGRTRRLRRGAACGVVLLALVACGRTEPQAKTTPLPTLEHKPPVDPTPSEPPSDPSSVESPTPTPTPRPHRATKLPKGMPRTFCALTAAGDLVEGSTATGGVKRVIATRAQLAKQWEPCPSPGEETVYFPKQVGESCFEVWSLQTSTGTRRRITRGDHPSTSPDGKRLAYVDYGNCGSKAIRVVVRNLSTGRERVFKEPYTVDETDGGMGPLTWLDGRRLLVEVCGVDACSPLMLDTAKRGNELAGTWFGPEKVDGEDVGGSVGSPMIRGRLGTVLMGVYEQDQRLGMIEYDWKRGTAKRFPLRDVVACDASGRFLLYFDETRELIGWYDGKTIRIGPGYDWATW